MQAVLNATQQEDEFVKEYLITYEKVRGILKQSLKKKRKLKRSHQIELAYLRDQPLHVSCNR